MTALASSPRRQFWLEVASFLGVSLFVAGVLGPALGYVLAAIVQRIGR